MPLTNPGRNVNPDECPDNLLCTEQETLALLLSIDVTKANGPDNVSGKMLKCTAHSIAPVITRIFNQSIMSGVFPQSWKSSNVVPIPKKSDKSSPTNYRPISLLSVLSKLLEKHVHSIISCHLEEIQSLSQSQWGFQKGESTLTGLLQTTQTWFQLLN